MARILIVDDEPGVIITLKTMLKVDGHEVIVAENGVSGISILEKSKDSLDLVITDIQMPEMDGLQFISRILSIAPGLRVIAISGGGNRLSNVDPLASLSEKIFGTVRKPFTHDELFQVVNSALESTAKGGPRS